MRRLAGAALLAAVGLICAAAAPAYDWALPRGVKPPPVPADNPMSAAKVELGRRLFYDADLSADGTLSCAACHEQHRGFTEGNATHPGVKGALGRRNVMGLANVPYLKPLTWADPAQTTLEAQVAVPVTGDHPVEMGMQGQEAEIVRRLAAEPCYRQMFSAAFPETKGEITFDATAKAIAAFERTLISFDTPYDRHTLSPAARRGEALFRAKGCAGCHSGPNFTNGRFYAIAPPQGEDRGLIEKTGRPADAGFFRTPSLRNVELTGPYLHDGSARTITFAILSHTRKAPALSQDEAQQIAVFLDGLTDRTFTTNPAFALPTQFCGRPRAG